jgi:P27 family predicted phage terminase small subunit
MPRGGKRDGAGRKPKDKLAPPPRQAPRTAPVAFAVIEGGDLQISEPDWSAQFTDELDQALAHQQWLVIAGELRNTEKLAHANERQIKRLIDAYVLYEVAMRHVAEEGAVFPRKGKKQPAYNPWFTVLKDANAMASAAEAELTITPRRRNNGGKVQRKKPSLIGGGYLKSATR